VFLADADTAQVAGSNGECPVAADAAGAERPPALQVTGMTVRFGGIQAVDDVSVHVNDSEIVGLIGPNGAGKSTLFDLISGLLVPFGGRVVLGGVDVSDASTAARARAGLGRTFQDAHLFPALSVEETIAVAQDRWIAVRDPVREALRLPAAFDAEEAVRERTEELLGLLNLDPYRDVLVRELSTGTKRIVEIACALAQRPSVLLLDEPATGLAQREAEALQPLLTVVREELGAAIFIIEHDTALLAAVADRIVAMDLGRVIADGSATSVLHDPVVLSSYLGPTAEVSAHVLHR
jgi:ABC-type branched-subunit amino acid transport system ATPase component